MIIKAGYKIDDKDIPFSSSFAKEIGNGASVRFWLDTWIGNAPLKDTFSRLYALELHKDASVHDRIQEEKQPVNFFKLTLPSHGHKYRKTASAWFDAWCVLGPLCEIISLEDIDGAGFSRHAKVSDIVGSDFEWPPMWMFKYPILASVHTPGLNDTQDKLVWQGIDSVDRNATVSCIWESIRPRACKVSWFDVVWFNQCIPKHAFVMWLLMGERLKTQDRLKPWEIRANPVLTCVLCNEIMDSHDHLFFKCGFSEKVWRKVLGLIRVDVGGYDWKRCRDAIASAARGRGVNWIVAKLCFGACVYHIWQERNSRLFKRGKMSEEQLFESIRSNIRLKLMVTSFKNSRNVEQMKDWQLC
ncbi:uncharacterized protein [Rutidosis leptorrhynchoides]|uniref:uncharacterized protein n=1 Tax=Rutidosis leptorrhynchoides TaxID=125765 RepID=UPI003A99944E